MLLALLLATVAVCSTASSVLTVPVEWKDDSSPNMWQVAPYKLDWVYDRGHEELWALGVSAPPVAVFTPAPAPSTPASTDSEALYSTVDGDLEGGDARVSSIHKWDSTPEVLYQKLTPTTAPQIPIYGEAPVTVSYVRPQQESSLRELLNNYVRVRSSRVDAARHGEVAKIHSVIQPEYTAVKTATILQPIDVLKRVETVQRVVKPVLKITPVYSQLTSVRNYPAPPAPVVKKVVQNILPAPIVKKYFVSPPPVVKNVWKNILPPPILKKYFVSPPPVVQNVVKKILPAPIIKRYFITPTPIVNKIVRNVLPPPIIKKYLVSPPPVVKRVAVLPPPIINRYVVMPPPVIKHYFVEEPHGEVSSRNSTPTLSPITPVSNDPVPTTFSYPTTTPAPSTTPAPITTPAPTTTPTPTTTPLSTTTPVVEMFTNQVENLRSASLVQNSQSQEEVKKSTSEEVRKTTSEGEERSSKVAVQNVELEIPGVQSVGKVVVVETVRRVVDVDTLGSSAMEVPARSEQTVVDADGTVRKFERYVVYDTVPIKRRVVAQIPASIAEENKKSFVASMNSALVSSSFQGGQRWTVPSLSSSDRMVLETGRGISSDSALSSAALASTSSRATIQDGNWVLRYLSPATASTHSAIVQTAGDAEVLSNSAQRVLSSSQTVKTSSASQASRMESSSQVEAAAVKSSSASKGSSQQTAMQVDSQDREYQSTASQASRMESSSQVEATAVKSSSASKVFSQQTATQVDSQDREYQSKMRADSQSRGQQRALRVDSLDYQNAMQSDSQDRHHQQSALRADSQVIGHQSKQRAQHIMSISESLAASRAFHSKSSESLSSQQDARDSTTREGSVDQPAVVIKDLKNIGVLPEDMTVSSVTVKTT